MIVIDEGMFRPLILFGKLFGMFLAGAVLTALLTTRRNYLDGYRCGFQAAQTEGKENDAIPETNHAGSPAHGGGARAVPRRRAKGGHQGA